MLSVVKEKLVIKEKPIHRSYVEAVNKSVRDSQCFELH